MAAGDMRGQLPGGAALPAVPVYDHDTRQWTEVSHAEMTSAVQSGRYSPVVGEQIPVVGPKGEVGTIDSSEAHSAFNSGWRLESPEEIHQRQLKETYGAGEVAATTAVQGAMMGVWDAAVSQFDKTGKARRVAREMRAARPMAAVAGEVAGTALPALLSGGTGAAGTLARLTPAGAAARLGVGAERALTAAIARGGASKASAAIAKHVPGIVGAGVEGAAYGVGQAIREDTLGDAELTAERLLGHVGMGALFGAGAATGLTVAGLGAKGALRAAGTGAKATGDAVKRMYERATGHAPHVDLGKAWGKLSAFVAGAPDSAVVQKMMQQPFARGADAVGPRLRKIATQPIQVVDDAADELRTSAQQILNAAEDVTPSSLGESKLRNAAKIVKRGNEDTVAEQALHESNTLKASLDEMIDAGPGTFGYRADIKKLRDLAESRHAKILEAVNGPADELNARVFYELDNLKRDVGVFGKKTTRRQAATSADKAALERLVGDDGMGGLYERLRTQLERDDLFGAAANVQRETNKAWHDWLRLENYRGRHKFWTAFGQAGFRDRYEAVPEAWRAFARNLQAGTESLDYRYLRDTMERRVELMETIAKHYDLEPAQVKAVADARAAVKSFQGRLKTTTDEAQLIGQLADLGVLQPALGGVGATAAGFVAGGGVGAAIGGTLGTLASPADAIRRLSTMERLAEGVRGSMRSSIRATIDRAVKPAARATGRLASAVAVPAAVIGAESVRIRRDERRRKAEAAGRRAELARFVQVRNFRDEIGRLAEVLTNPSLASHRLGGALPGVTGAAPQSAERLAEKATAAASFLLNKAPKPPPGYGAGLTPQAPWEPTPTELSRYDRYARAVHSPLSVLDDLSAGVLSAEAVEAMRVVYPRLYADASVLLREQLAALKVDLPHATKQQISLFLGTPVDSTTTGGLTRAAQRAHATPENRKPAPRSKRESKIPGQYETESQRLEAR